MADEKPQEDIDLEAEKAKNPPRYMVALVDFKTDVQIHVGAPDIADFLKPYEDGKEKDLSANVHQVFVRYNQRKTTTAEACKEVEDLLQLRERFELERVFRYFKRKVKQAEDTPVGRTKPKGEAGGKPSS